MDGIFSNFQEYALIAVGGFFRETWWLILFFVSFWFARTSILAWRQRRFEHHTAWTFYEMKMPREIMKNPRGMDQILQSIAGLRNAPSDFQEKYGDGEVSRFFTMEMVSFSGEIHFYMRVYKKQKSLFEAAFFSNYPDVELIESPDYMSQLPKNMEDIYAAGADIWGTEMLLKKSPLYPIRSYLTFESPEETQQFDPMSGFLELLGKVKQGEFLGIQYNVAPHLRDWGTDHSLMSELAELKKPKQMDRAGADEFGFPMTIPRSPGETDVIKAIEANLAKPAYKCVIRFLYISPKTIYYDSFARRGVLSAFNQYSTAELNTFYGNPKMISKTKSSISPYIFPKLRGKLKAQRLFNYYKTREFETEVGMGTLMNSHPFNWANHSKPIILNTESLATLFHPPMGIVLTAPHTKRVESRKVGPSAGLPIYGDEKELDRFIKEEEIKETT